MTKLTIPNSDKELKDLLDNLYKTALSNKENNLKQKFKGLLETISSEPVILTALHNIKSNKGSKTAGVDDEDINNILQGDYAENIKIIQDNITQYTPSEIRRVYIKKSNGKFRPLGIPTIMERIIQECIRIVIEPILEAQFFKHSYGFRPYRETAHAVERIIYINNRIGYNWVVEGDIKGCFDNMNHRIMIKQLWNMGIKDRRLLTIINAMLNSPINDKGHVEECIVGIPQGGILSPLLANAYMHKLDMWVSREWENKKLRTATTNKTNTLRKHSTIENPEFFVRYADDWVILTDSNDSAEYWKHKISNYLKNSMKLELSDEKTHITDMKKKSINFVGFKIKMVRKGKGGKFVGYSYPSDDRLKEKMIALKPQLKKVKWASNNHWRVHEINLLNSKMRGLLNYYGSATGVNLSFRKYKEWYKYASYKAVKKRGGKWKPANQCANLKIPYQERSEQVAAIKADGNWIGIIPPTFVTWKKVSCKNHDETPFTQEGRFMYTIKTGRTQLLDRSQELLDAPYGSYIKVQSNKRKSKFYTLEFYLNRCYAFNRDKGKCKVCSEDLNPKATETHHVDISLPIDKLNKVTNLASVCRACHHLIHSNISLDETKLDIKAIKKLTKYRSYFDKLNQGSSVEPT